MTAGFRIRNSAGQVIFSDADLALMFLDQFVVSSGTVQKVYAGMAGSTLKVIRLGTNSRGSATISQSTSGIDRVITLTVTRECCFIVTRE